MPMRILIVDDTTTARVFAQKCLANIGLHDAEFIQAVHGLDALKKIRENPPDLILTDLIMPEMDGETLLKELKNDADLNHIPVLVVSSAANVARKDALMAMGALDVLPKPFSTTEIYNVLKIFLEPKEGSDAWGE
ncbi:MAG: response regulator [Proteobacteria bacterium]|nr:response regulator [Pseudomonadota bacterium]MBU1639287.1 response regulator [Pseudomonadota bacterium]